MANGQANAVHNQVVRSLLMTGATRTRWAPRRSLDARHREQSRRRRRRREGRLQPKPVVLNAGERTLQTVTGSSIPNVVTNNLKGWAYGTSTSGQQAILINSTADISQLSATLNWNVTQSTAGSTIDTSDSGRIFADLALDCAPSLFPAAAMPSASRQASSG